MGGDLPKDVHAKRALLYSDKATDAERNAVATAYADAERFGEALEFLEMTGDPELLDRIQAAAVERGDTFLLMGVERIREERAPAAEWQRILERAKARGKFLDAYRALGRLGREEEAEALREKEIPEFKPFKPEGK